MKFLHTADWHVGKTLKGRDRLDEQKAVLAEIAAVAEANEVDAVLVAGDVYDLSAPSAAAQQLVVQTLLRMRRSGAEVIVIAGNHDHGPTFEAYRPLMGEVGITLTGAYKSPERGGVVRFTARSDGAPAQVAVLPFLSQRYAVRAAEIVANSPSENVRAYDEQMRQVIASLTASFRGDTVNLAMSHLTCVGGKFGGGERSAQSIFEYSVPAAIFPVNAHYVALGHLHRRQSLPAPAPVHYSGAPLAVDFGEQDNTSVVCLVEAAPGIPARVTDVPVTSGRRLRTAAGTLAELEARARRASPTTTSGCTCASRAAPGCATTPWRSCRTPWRSASTPSSRRRQARRTARPSRAPRARRSSCSPSTAARGTSATRGSPPCSAELHDEVTATDGAADPAELSTAG